MIRDTYELGEPATMSSALDALIAAFPHNPPETEISDKYFGDWLMRAAEDPEAMESFSVFGGGSINLATAAARWRPLAAR